MGDLFCKVPAPVFPGVKDSPEGAEYRLTKYTTEQVNALVIAADWMVNIDPRQLPDHFEADQENLQKALKPFQP